MNTPTHFPPVGVLADRPWALRFVLGLAVLLLATRVTAPGQSAPDNRPLPVERATDVVSQWRPDQHLYIKGDLGVGAAQLAELEQWLETRATNWVVVLVESAANEEFLDADGRTYSGLDAVEHALGKGLPNRTGFGAWTDPRTGERNGAFFILFLKERKFSYYGSDAFDRRGLGEDRWNGRLDGPAIAAMRGGGRIVDAAKDTITSIERQLTQKITAEVRLREQREAAARAARERALDQARAALVNGSNAVATLQRQLDHWTAGREALTGDLTQPDLPQMLADLTAAADALQSDNPAAAASLADQVAQRARTATRGIEAWQDAAAELTGAESKLKSLAAGRESAVAARDIAAAREALDRAQQAHTRGDSSYTPLLQQSQRLIQSGDARIRAAILAAERKRVLLVGGGGAAGLILLFTLVALNRRRRGARREALALYESWSKALAEKADALVDLLNRAQTYLGSSRDAVAARFSGLTLNLGRQAVTDVDELFIMSACAARVHRDTQPLIHPDSIAGRARNLFAKRNYLAAIRRLRDEPIVFRPEERLELILRGPKSPRDHLLGTLDSYQPFALSFDALIGAFNERADRALSALDRIQSSLGSVESSLASIQSSLDTTKGAEAGLRETAEADGFFALVPLFEELLPAVQRDLDDAGQTAVNDPVAALENQAVQARRKASDAAMLIQLAHRVHRDIRPQLSRAAEQLKAVPLETAWIGDALAELSDRANVLCQTALGSPIADSLPPLNGALNTLSSRADRIVALDNTRRNESWKSVEESQRRIETVRQQLAGPLTSNPEQILREPDLDPSNRLDQGREQLAAAKAALERGDDAGAQDGLDAAARLIAETNAIVDDTEAAFRAHEETLSARRNETRRLEQALPEHEEILRGIETRYAPDVLLLGQGDPAHPNANGTIHDNLREAREQLDTARKLADDAEQQFRKASILASADLLRRAAACQEFAGDRLGEIREKQDRIRQTEQANNQLQETLSARVTELDPAVRDARTMRPTMDQFEAARDRLAAADRLRSATPRQPFQVAAELEAVKTELARVSDQARRDREVHAEADRSLKAAEAQLEVARRLAREAASDAAEDSAAIHQARAGLEPLGNALDRAEAALAQPHGNWHQADAEADRVLSEAGHFAATLRRELQAAQAALSAMSAASNQVRSAGVWTGGFGVTIMGSPGSGQLARARHLLGDGNYDEARMLAEAAQRAAAAAVAAAIAEVRRRQREEEERQERERRRREAEERRRRSAMNSLGSGRSSSGFGRSGFSSSSGAGRSSFSRGSGVGRSGW